MNKFLFKWAGVFLLSLLCSVPVKAQNISLQVTPMAINRAVTPTVKPTPLRNLSIPVAEVEGANLEAMSNARVIYSEDTSATYNKTLYEWQPGSDRLINLKHQAVAGSVRISQNGKFMLFLYDETRDLQDLNNDRIAQTLLRLYYFPSGHVFNLGIPAKSAKGADGSNIFEYDINDEFVTFTRSLTARNDGYQSNAPWQVLPLISLVHAIEGTPTPTPSFTPIGTATPTPIPSPTASPTQRQGIPPDFRTNVDMNGDGEVNMLDLLLFQLYWAPQGKPSPTPTFFTDTDPYRDDD